MRSWFYRCNLVLGTILVIWILFIIQNSLFIDSDSTVLSLWQQITCWAETIWIIPVPVALLFWVGWFVFAQPMRSEPVPIPVPTIKILKTGKNYGYLKKAYLVFRIVTRGENVEVLRENIAAIHDAFAHYPQEKGPYRIEVVSECPVDVAEKAQAQTVVYVVPGAYVTAHKSLFKARAMTYLQEQVRPEPEEWYVYLDEESLVDEVFVAGLYQFIQRSEALMHRSEKRHPQGIIGQGTIIYQGGHWFFRSADAMRTADDLGRFRLQYGLGVPLFGMHGSFIVVRGIDDARLSFDVGPGSSIAEDAAWALHAWRKGFRFTWIDGFLYEQPPQSVKDFIKQRCRWLIGIRGVLRDNTLPLRYRLGLGIFTYSWHLSLFPTIIAILALFTHTTAFFWVQIPANFVWAVFFLSYLQGIDMQVRRTKRFCSGEETNSFWQRVLAYPFALGIFWYTLLESVSIFYSCICPRQGFFVIKKNKLNSKNM